MAKELQTNPLIIKNEPTTTNYHHEEIFRRNELGTKEKDDVPYCSGISLSRDNAVNSLLLAAHAMANLHTGNTPPVSPQIVKESLRNYASTPTTIRTSSQNLSFHDINASKHIIKRKPFYESKHNYKSQLLSNDGQFQQRKILISSSSNESNSEDNDEDIVHNSPSHSNMKQNNRKTSKPQVKSKCFSKTSLFLLSPLPDSRRIKRSRIASTNKSQQTNQYGIPNEGNKNTNENDNEEQNMPIDVYYQTRNTNDFLNKNREQSIQLTPRRTQDFSSTFNKNYDALDKFMKISDSVSNYRPYNREPLTPVSSRLIDFSRKIDMNPTCTTPNGPEVNINDTN